MLKSYVFAFLDPEIRRDVGKRYATEEYVTFKSIVVTSVHSTMRTASLGEIDTGAGRALNAVEEAEWRIEDWEQWWSEVQQQQQLPAQIHQISLPWRKRDQQRP